jgi:hypothetical protein
MILNIAKHNVVGGIENGVYYFKLLNYPHIALKELKIAASFIMYEKAHNREAEIVCDDEHVIRTIKNAVANYHELEPFTLTDETKFVYHGTDINCARKILSCGKLLSAVNVYGKTSIELAYDKRDSPWNDPADYFEYIMFCNGDDMTGDYVVLSENFPSNEDLEDGCFDAGVRLYIQSEDIVLHPGFVFDGYHPAKVKDEIILTDYLFACIVPEQYKKDLVDVTLPELSSRVHYLSQKGMSLTRWNDKVVDFIYSLCSSI